MASATDEEKLLSLLDDRRFVLVILSVELPDKDGFALFRKVKKADRDLPVIITTSTVLKAELSRHETQNPHAECYLDKADLSDSDLLGAIADAAGLELTSRDADEHAQEIDDLEKRLIATQRDRDPGRGEATELKGLLDSLQVKHDELTEQTDAVRARHERASEELTERHIAAQKARDEARQETSEVRGLLDGVRARLGKLTGQVEATRAKHEQEIEELTDRLVAIQRDRDEGARRGH